MIPSCCCLPTLPFHCLLKQLEQQCFSQESLLWQFQLQTAQTFFRLGLLVVILIRSSFCGAFSFVEPLVCCLLLDSESPSGSKARELRRSWPLSFIWFRQSRKQNIQKRMISSGQITDGISGGRNCSTVSFAI